MSSSLDPLCVFDRFVVGPGNRVAASAALRVAESPGRSYNPLVISGPEGVGKTHLLMAIGERARAFDADLLVHYETADAFVERVTSSLSAGTLEAFRAAWVGIDVLLLDGLEQVAAKGRTQKELLRLAEELVGRGAQLVVAANAPLAEIPALDARLVARLAGGLNVEISPLDRVTRRAIVARLVEEHGFDLSDEVASSLADLPIADVGELRSAVTHVVAAAELEDRRASVADVARLTTMALDGAGAGPDEFDAFLSDISTAVAAVVETAPWRRRVAEAILRWEGEGIRTRRLEAALDADSAPDVEALLTAFGRDVGRLRHLARELPAGAVADPMLLRDPDRLPEAERLLEEVAGEASTGQKASAPGARTATLSSHSVDHWFLDREKLAWEWLALDDRMVEEQR